MAQLIEVNGEVVEFPDGMSDQQIAAALSGAQKPEAPSGLVKGLTDPFAGAAQLIGKGLSYAGISYGDTLADYYTNLEKEYTKQRQDSGETGIDWSRIVGNVVSPANFAAGALGTATKFSKPIQAMIAGAGAGTITPVEGQDFAKEKGEQVALGAALGPVGEMATRGIGRVLSPNIGPAEKAVRSLGVTPTPGQAIGGQMNAFETFAQNLPIVGGNITDAKTRNIVKFNQGVINNSLKKVNELLPDDLVGNDAIVYANNVKNNVYNNALKDTKLTIGLKDKARMKSAVLNSKLFDESEVRKADKILDIIAFKKLPQGNSVDIDGEVFKSIDSELKSEIFSLKNSGDLSDRRVGGALESAQKYIRELFGKQNPEKSSILRRADTLDRDLRVLQTAAASSGAEKGVFTPKQYQTAVRQSDKTRGKVSYARGKANGQEVAQAGLEVLGEEADAILQGRIGAQVAGGLTISTNPLIGAAIGSAIKAGYSPAGLRVIDALVAKRPRFAFTLGEMIKRNSAGLGGITSQEIIDAYNKSEENSPMEIEITGGELQ
jgi:hypothetical protein